jgi:hypothetical protein
MENYLDFWYIMDSRSDTSSVTSKEFCNATFSPKEEKWLEKECY